MILNEGIKVRIGADNRELLQAFRGGSLAATAMKGSIVAALAAITIQSARMASQLDRDLRLIATLGGEAAGNTQRLRREVQQLGIEFGRSFNEIAQANYQAVSSGFTRIADSMKLTTAGTKLAVAGNGDLVSSTKLVASVLNAFGKDASQAEQAAANLFSIIRAGQIDAAQMGTLLQDLPAAASGVGVSMDEMGAALSVLTVQTGSVSKAVDQLRSLFVKLAVEGIQGSSLQERLDQLAGMDLPALTKALGDQNAALAASIFVSKPDLLPNAMGSFADQVEKLDEAVETMTDGSTSRFEQAQQRINEMMTEFGSAILPSVVTNLEAIVSLYDQIKTYGAGSLFTGGAGAQRDPGMVFDSGAGRDVTLPVSGTSGLLVEGDKTYAVTSDGRTVEVARIDDRGGFSLADAVEAATVGDVTYLLMPDGKLYPAQQYVGAAPTVIRPIGDPDVGPAFDPNMPDGQRFLFGTPGFQEVQPRYGAAMPTSDPTLDLIAGDLKDFDFSELDREFGDLQTSSTLAAASASILSGAVGGALVSAFVTADNAAGRFIQGILAQFAQLGVRTAFSSIFGLPGFSSGGYTGGGGIVHENEYVFNADAVRSIGLGRLERMHAVAQAGSTYNLGGITVNAPSGDASAIASVTADMVGAKLRELDVTGRRNLYNRAPAKYGR